MVSRIYANIIYTERASLLVLEDFLQMLLQLVQYGPDIFFQSPAFPTAFRAVMAALTLVHTDIIFAALDLFRVILTHDCLLPGAAVPPPKFPLYAASIQAVFEKEGFEFVGYLLAGLIGDFPEDSTSAVVSIFRAISSIWSSQLLSWLPAILQQLPNAAAPNDAKTQFLTDITRFGSSYLELLYMPHVFTPNSAVHAHEYDKVKYAILALNRASRKARERRRVALDR